MNLRQVADTVEAAIYHGEDEDLNASAESAAASDLMSDILNRIDVADVLLTGLNTTQIIHTASVSGIKAVIVVRGKTPDSKIIELAEEEGIVLMSTKMSLFEASGKLYSAGLHGVGKPL